MSAASLKRLCLCVSILVGFGSSSPTTNAVVLAEKRSAGPVCPGKYLYRPRKPYRCNYMGSLENGLASYSNTSASVLNDCVNTCATDRRCISFGYTPSASQSCSLFNAAVPSPSNGNSGITGTRFYNHHCFIPEHYKIHPIQNGGFETGTTQSWTGLISQGSGTGSIGATPMGEDSNYAASLGVSEPADNGDPNNEALALLYQNFRACEGVTYTVSLSFYQPTGQTTDDPSNSHYVVANAIVSAPPRTNIYLLEGATLSETNLANGSDDYTAGEWHDIQVTFTAPVSSAQYRLSLQLATQPSTSALLYFDNIAITASTVSHSK